MTPYERYMKSEGWRQEREARLRVDGYRCRLCDHDGSVWRLEVHHRPSSYARIPNESVADDVTTLCVRCHDAITDAIRSDRYASRQYTVSVQVSDIPTRKEAQHDMATSYLSIDIRLSDDRPQRAACQPAQSVDEEAQGHQRQGQED